MKKYIILTMMFIILGILTSNPIQACSAFSAKVGNRVLVGASDDSYMDEPWAYFYPATTDDNGYVIFLWDRGSFLSMQGGFNDRGLVVEMAGAPDMTNPPNIYNKPKNTESILNTVLTKCSTVDEATELISQFYWVNFTGAHCLITDKSGNSVIVEWNDKDLVAVAKTEYYQVMTNHFNNDLENERWYACYRYKIAKEIFEENNDISVDLFTTICDAVHTEGETPTQNSQIYDPVNGDVYVFYFHNFNEYFKFNLDEELAKGEHQIKLSTLFKQTKTIYPIEDEVVNPTNVTFEWMGDGDNYKVCFSTNPDFTDADYASVQNFGKIQFACLFTLILSGISFTKRKTLAVVLIIVSVVMIMSCEDSILYPPDESDIEHSQTVSNLQPDTQYYWKVITIDIDGRNVETVTASFKTRVVAKVK